MSVSSPKSNADAAKRLRRFISDFKAYLDDLSGLEARQIPKGPPDGWRARFRAKVYGTEAEIEQQSLRLVDRIITATHKVLPTEGRALAGYLEHGPGKDCTDLLKFCDVVSVNGSNVFYGKTDDVMKLWVKVKYQIERCALWLEGNAAGATMQPAADAAKPIEAPILRGRWAVKKQRFIEYVKANPNAGNREIERARICNRSTAGLWRKDPDVAEHLPVEARWVDPEIGKR